MRRLPHLVIDQLVLSIFSLQHGKEGDDIGVLGIVLMRVSDNDRIG